ncbi:hypothetical protein ACQPUY_07425 [Clostridium nigeriense]
MALMAAVDLEMDVAVLDLIDAVDLIDAAALTDAAEVFGSNNKN